MHFVSGKHRVPRIFFFVLQILYSGLFEVAHVYLISFRRVSAGGYIQINALHCNTTCEKNHMQLLVSVGNNVYSDHNRTYHGRLTANKSKFQQNTIADN